MVIGVEGGLEEDGDGYGEVGGGLRMVKAYCCDGGYGP